MDNWYGMYTMGRERMADTLEFAENERRAAEYRRSETGRKGTLWVLLISLSRVFSSGSADQRKKA